MKKVFFALLFLSIAGAAVLVWLIRSAPSSPKVTASEPQGLTIVDEKHEEAAKVSATAEGEKAEHAEAHEHEPGAKAESAEEHGHEHASEAKSASKEKELKSESKVVPVLTVRTEPPGAQVRVDGVVRGKTPYELALTDKEQKVEVAAEGFEPFTRTAPAAKEAGNGQLGWRVQLKSKPEVAHEEAPAKVKAKKAHEAVKSLKHAVVPPPSANEIVHVGRLGPYVIQFKSVERKPGSEAAVKEVVEKMRADLKSISVGDVIVGCAVDLGAKGRWVRVVTGPFESKQAAAARLAHYKNVVSDAYVTGAQKCQP